jgi:hypothetical protein
VSEAVTGGSGAGVSEAVVGGSGAGVSEAVVGGSEVAGFSVERAVAVNVGDAPVGTTATSVAVGEVPAASLLLPIRYK